MFKYTFSTREKIMLGLLVVVALAVAWYQLLYMPIQNRIAELDSQIAATQDEIVMRRATAASLENMQSAIAEYESKGYTPLFLPSYDNTQQLMAYLNGVLSVTSSYSMSFDAPTKADDGTVHRSGSINYSVADYASARSVVNSIARGPYSCRIDSLGITDKNVGSDSSKGSGSAVSVNLQVTFLERITAGTEVEEDKEDDAQEGQDLSVLINRDNM